MRPLGSPTTNAAPLAFLAVTVVIWGTSYWPTAVAAEHASSLALAVLRTLPSALLLLALLPVLGGRVPRGRMLWWAIGTSVPMITLFYWGVTDAITRAGAGNAAVLVNTPPLWVALFAWLLLHERLWRGAILGLLVGFCGVVLMVSSQLGGDQDTTQLLIGMGLALAVALGWAGGTLALKRLAGADGFEFVGFTAVQYLASAALLTPIAIAVDGFEGTDWSSPELWGATFWIGPMNALGAVTFYLALSRLTASQTSAALFLVPAVAVVVEIIRGNAPTTVVLAGMALTVVGVALVNTPPDTVARMLRLRPKPTG